MFLSLSPSTKNQLKKPMRYILLKVFKTAKWQLLQFGLDHDFKSESLISNSTLVTTCYWEFFQN